MNKNVVILSFSGRKNGNCSAICDYIERFYMRTNVLSFKIDSISFSACGGCDYECLKQGLLCPKLTEEQRMIMDAITQCDLAYFIVPNFCGYPCSNYFAFNERSVGYFNMDQTKMEKYMAVPKRFIIVSNSHDEIFVNAMRQQTNSEPDILYLSSSQYGKQSIAGDILDANEAKADLKAFLVHDPCL